MGDHSKGDHTVEATHPLRTQHAGAASPSVPTLPASAPRSAPKFERRNVEVDLSTTRRNRHTSPKAYLVGAAGLATISVAGWFVLGEYIYG